MAGRGSDDAAGLMARANKLIQPSIWALRLAPDWEQATPLLEQAANMYKVGGSHEKHGAT